MISPHQQITTGPLQGVGAERTPETNSLTTTKPNSPEQNAHLLLRQRNERESLIYPLPTELLWLVASHLPKESLINATHVSHQLRATLLSDPGLWIGHDFSCIEEAFEFLKRSKLGLITVFADNSSCPYHSTRIDLSNKHTGEIETFTFKRSLRRLPMPPSMMLGVSCRDRRRMFSGPGDVYNFDGLTTLVARGGEGFRFNTPDLTNLQVNSFSMLEGRDFLRFLAHCPLLEELKVDYEWETLIHEPSPDIPDTVELPHLRFYSHSTRETCRLRIFDRLSIPPSCSVVFNYWSDPLNARKSSEVIHFRNPSPPAAVQRVKINTDDVDAVDTVDTAVEFIDAKNRRVYTVISVNRDEQDMNDPDDPYKIGQLYVDYLKNLDASATNVLCVQGKFPWTPFKAGEVLSFFLELGILVLTGSAVTSYIPALAPDSFNGAHMDEWPCHKLNALVVRVPDVVLTREMEKILHHLADTTKRRKEVGMPLRSVSLSIRSPLEDTQCCQTSLETLRRSVEKVEIVVGDDLDWDTDDYFFRGLDIRRDRDPSLKQKPDLRASRFVLG